MLAYFTEEKALLFLHNVLIRNVFSQQQQKFNVLVRLHCQISKCYFADYCIHSRFIS